MRFVDVTKYLMFLAQASHELVPPDVSHTLLVEIFFCCVKTVNSLQRRINALDQWCLRRILNITWSEHVTNSENHRRTGQPLLSDIVRARRLKLFGHVARADKSQDHSRALRACIWHSPKNWKRRLGRPRHTWLRTVEADLRPFNLGLASGFKKAQDRTTWRALTGTATSPTSPEWWWWWWWLQVRLFHLNVLVCLPYQHYLFYFWQVMIVWKSDCR